MPTRTPNEDEVQVHLHLDRELWRRVKVRAAQDGTTAVAVVRGALQEWLRKGGKR
jgi:plasmid stability protein